MSLGRRYLKISRAKKGAASECKVPASQQEAAVKPDSVGQLRETFAGLLDETFREEDKKLNDRLQTVEQEQ